jgi:UDP-GlcNAc:undecaprenyl-phosphate GlcNAc-1-phosphate transferase
MVGTINSINLMDGLDGLASGFSILTILFIGFLGYYKDYEIVVIISTALLGTLLSFLKYNSYPAKIFLGDSGSLVLGYFLVFLSIEILRPFGTKTLDLTFPVLLLGVPIIDTLKVMYLRMREGRLPFTPDKKHLHHVIFGNNIRHKTTVFIIHTLSIGFMLNALFYLRYHNELTYLIFFLMGLFLISIKKLISLSNFVVKIIKDISGSLFKLPSLAKDIYTKLFIPLSIISFVLLLLLQFRYVSVGASKLHLAMLATGITLFTTAVYSFIKTNLISPIYVFFNILFYLTFNYFLKEESRFILADILLFPNLLNHLLFYFLAFVVLVFLIIRYSLLPKEEIFLSGMDLTLLSIAMLFFIVQPLSQWDLTALNYSLIVSLVVYIWFKIVQYYFKRTSMFLYFGLFLVNFIILGVSYIV